MPLVASKALRMNNEHATNDNIRKNRAPSFGSIKGAFDDWGSDYLIDGKPFPVPVIKNLQTSPISRGSFALSLEGLDKWSCGASLLEDDPLSRRSGAFRGLDELKRYSLQKEPSIKLDQFALLCKNAAAGSAKHTTTFKKKMKPSSPRKFPTQSCTSQFPRRRKSTDSASLGVGSRLAHSSSSANMSKRVPTPPNPIPQTRGNDINTSEQHRFKSSHSNKPPRRTCSRNRSSTARLNTSSGSLLSASHSFAAANIRLHQSSGSLDFCKTQPDVTVIRNILAQGDVDIQDLRLKRSRGVCEDASTQQKVEDNIVPPGCRAGRSRSPKKSATSRRSPSRSISVDSFKRISKSAGKNETGPTASPRHRCRSSSRSRREKSSPKAGKSLLGGEDKMNTSGHDEIESLFLPAASVPTRKGPQKNKKDLNSIFFKQKDTVVGSELSIPDQSKSTKASKSSSKATQGSSRDKAQGIRRTKTDTVPSDRVKTRSGKRAISISNSPRTRRSENCTPNSSDTRRRTRSPSVTRKSTRRTGSVGRVRSSSSTRLHSRHGDSIGAKHHSRSPSVTRKNSRRVESVGAKSRSRTPSATRTAGGSHPEPGIRRTLTFESEALSAPATANSYLPSISLVSGGETKWNVSSTTKKSAATGDENDANTIQSSKTHANKARRHTLKLWGDRIKDAKSH